jgi:twinkle protein
MKPAPDPETMKKPDALVTVDKQRNGDFEGKLSMWFDDDSLRFVDDRLSPVEPYVAAALQRGRP